MKWSLVIGKGKKELGKRKSFEVNNFLLTNDFFLLPIVNRK